jgi:hypothetical protein
MTAGDVDRKKYEDLLAGSACVHAGMIQKVHNI